MKRLLAVMAGLAIALVGTMAVAAWLSTGSAAGSATATSVNQAHAPSATRGVNSLRLSWTASTLADGSPVGGYQLLRHSGSTATVICTVTSPGCVDSSPLAGAVTYGVVATIGTSWRGPESTVTAFTYDDRAPGTTASVSPNPNAAGWNRTSVTVTLSATDGGIASGVNHISYSIDGGATQVIAGASGTFGVSGAGTHAVTFWAVDQVGNTEVDQHLVVKIDPDAPVTVATPTPAPNAAGWNRTDVSLGFVATDSGTSGIKSVTVDGVPTSGATASATLSAEGTTTVHYFATDNADNVEGTKSLTVKIDKTAPTASIDPASGSGWTSDNTVAISASDALSGLASTQYSVDGGALQTYTGPVTLADGARSFRYVVTDAAGNVTDRTATINVDAAAPTASLSQTGGGQPTISGTDATSGVASVSWRDGGSGSYTTVAGSSTTLSLSGGSHTIWYFATDNAGNSSTPTSQVVTIGADTVAPTITDVMNGVTSWTNNNNGANSWNGGACAGNQVCATTTDSGSPTSGIKPSSISFTLVRGTTCWNGTSFVTGTSCQVTMAYNSSTGRITATVPQSAMTDGAYSLKIHVEDNAGNVKDTTVSLTMT